MMRLVQIIHPKAGRRIAKIDGGRCLLIENHTTIYGLAGATLRSGDDLIAEVEKNLSVGFLDYDAVYNGQSDWKLLPAFDHPEEPARCLVIGTGLTHKASAESRQTMHKREKEGEMPVTDSMRMYQWGLKGGKPEPGAVGVQPEWFYKGCGTILKAHGETLEVPPFADDGGEEPEVAGAYIIDPRGRPRRVGLMIANEFSDHVMEKKNYLYLAPSKLRPCAVGPELIVGAPFQDVAGTVAVERNGKVVWSRSIATGEANMSHTMANLEHHHFKYDAHRRPGDAHVYFFGADAFSFGEGIALEDGDVMAIFWDGFGRTLRNPIRINRGHDTLVRVDPL
jgi:hypothetical protein